MAEACCVRGQLDQAMKAKDYAAALTDRVELARVWSRLLSLQTAIVSTPGELGTIANLEQHTRKESHFLDQHDAALSQALGKPLPPEAAPSQTYSGPRSAHCSHRPQCGGPRRSVNSEGDRAGHRTCASGDGEVSRVGWQNLAGATRPAPGSRRLRSEASGSPRRLRVFPHRPNRQRRRASLAGDRSQPQPNRDPPTMTRQERPLTALAVVAGACVLASCFTTLTPRDSNQYPLIFGGVTREGCAAAQPYQR
jgi:hypothetical protein